MQCDQCHGQGYITSEAGNVPMCPKCYGSGVIANPPEGGKCEGCYGVGYYHGRNNQCTDCGGSGILGAPTPQDKVKCTVCSEELPGQIHRGSGVYSLCPPCGGLGWVDASKPTSFASIAGAPLDKNAELLVSDAQVEMIQGYTSPMPVGPFESCGATPFRPLGQTLQQMADHKELLQKEILPLLMYIQNPKKYVRAANLATIPPHNSIPLDVLEEWSDWAKSRATHLIQQIERLQ